MRRKRKRPKGWRPPDLTVDEILAWADAHFARTGRWPKSPFGPAPIPGTHGETWGAVHNALQKGRRGLPGGTTLARLLAAHRGVRNLKALPPWTEAQLLEWADAFQARTGRWPTQTDWAEPIPGADGETWLHAEQALAKGLRGLPGGSSLARLLAEHRGVRNPGTLPRLTADELLAWADAHFARTGRWPTCHGPDQEIEGAAGETWVNLDQALRKGLRGFPGGSSLARLLAEHRDTPLSNAGPNRRRGGKKSTGPTQKPR